MSKDWKGIVKNGWHPEKEGTTLKSQVSGLFGRGDKQQTSSSHAPRPITELRDPSSYGPPPKRNPNAPLPPPPLSSSQSSSAAPPLPPARQQSYGQTTDPYQQPHEEPVETAPPTKPKPWKLDNTGLLTSHLPPPPSRHDVPDSRSPPPPPYSKTNPHGPPSLPPRLPPRSSGTGSPSPTAPAAPHQQQHQSSGFLNQGAINRLGQSGISVPALGIGKPASPQPAATGSTTSTPSSNNLSSLSNKFSRLNTSTTPHTEPSTAPPSQGTTWAQKQAALRTASNFHRDPSSVSFSDARAAASTANNFRERHGEQMAGGLSAANKLNQRFGVAEKAGFGNGNGNGNGSGGGQDDAVNSAKAGLGQVAGVASALGKKKPPPPPPPKRKPGLLVVGSGGDEGPPPPPPPVPLNTRPNF